MGIAEHPWVSSRDPAQMAAPSASMFGKTAVAIIQSVQVQGPVIAVFTRHPEICKAY